MKAKQTRNKPSTSVISRHPVATFLLILGGAATVIGCGYSLITDHSVRFNDYRTGRAFYRLPPLPIMYDKTTGTERYAFETESNFEESYEENVDRNAKYTAEVSGLWEEANVSIAKSELSRAREELTKFLDLTYLPPSDLPGDDDQQNRRNASTDMLDAMTALRQGTSSSAVMEYLQARRFYYYASAPPKPEDLERPVKVDRNLRDNWDYLEAATLYRSGDKENARDRFRQLASQYPRSEKREAALYMAAKIAMESSHSYDNSKCGVIVAPTSEDPYEPEFDPNPPSPQELEPVEKCQDANWSVAIDEFLQLMAKHPNGRYFDDARGWVAHLHRRGGERAEALAEYYRMLGHETDWVVRLEAKKSLQMIGHSYDDATLDQVEKLIASDVNAAMAYAYHRIYNHAIDYSYEAIEPWFYPGSDYAAVENEKQRVEKVVGKGGHELERVARFATALMKQHPQARVSGGFVLRLAEAQLELQKFDEANELARKALSLGVSSDLRTQALWVKGSSEHAVKNFKTARSTFLELVSEFPNSKYTEGARRLLAMTAEDQGDLEFALEQYLALKYDLDIAYFIDVLLPTDRLAKFIANRPVIAQRDQLVYALGIRYMRDRRWNDARSTLLKVKTAEGAPRVQFDPGRTVFAKEPNWEPGREPFVDTAWVVQDLKAIDTLEHLEKNIEVAPTDDAKAEAMYQLASYQFESDALLFYNTAAWQGSRYTELSELDFAKRYRAPNESQLLFEYFQSHDTLARAIPIYLDIASRYPETKTAKDALYSAAVAHERLSDLNPYWRSVYEKGLFAGPRMVTYADVRSTYPKYQLPRATYGWEPATRTVRGGPGWVAPPKPQPRETKEHRIKRLLKEFRTEVSNMATRLSGKVETKVNAEVEWYGSAIQAAVYGTIAGVGLWAIFLAGLEIRTRRLAREIESPPDDPPGVDSRVDKMIE